MGQLKIQISDDVEKKFREIAMKRYGHKKGAISLAAQRALEEWTSKGVKEEAVRTVNRRTTKDPVDEIVGLLAHVKNKTSVQLQHEASKYRAEMALGYKKRKR